MERYLKEEPKQPELHKLPCDLDTPWNIFAVPSSWQMEVGALCIEDEANDRQLDTLSTSSASSGFSAMSWDSTVSCSVVVKKEPLDYYEDEELSSYDDLLRPREAKRIKRERISNDSNNNQTLVCKRKIKVEPRTSRLGSSRGLKQHNQARNTSTSSHSDSSSSTHSSCSSSSRNQSLGYQHQMGKQSTTGETTALVQPKTESTTELKMLARSHQKQNSSSGGCSDSSDLLPILTPPSSPESIRNAAASEAELALLGHQGLIRVSSVNGNIPRSAAMRLLTSNSGLSTTKSTTRSSSGPRILNVSQGLPTAAVTQRNANMPTSQAATSEFI